MVICVQSGILARINVFIICIVTVAAVRTKSGPPAGSSPTSHSARHRRRHSRLRAVFSDLDGTLVHYEKDFQQHGVKVISRNPRRHTAIVESPSGARRVCRLLPSKTMGDAFVSKRSADLIEELRSEGVVFIVVTAARNSTLHERLQSLPEFDAICGEAGSRVYLGDGSLDSEWAARLEHVCGPLDRELAAEERPESLWRFFRLLNATIPGLTCDMRSYTGCFRVETNGNASVDAALRSAIQTSLPRDLAWSTNLGKYDFYPRIGGKGNVVSYLQKKFGVHTKECACLFDDDNDLPMAFRCGSHYLPSLTSASVRRAVTGHPSWVVASKEGQGVFASEECLEQLLEQVRDENRRSDARQRARRNRWWRWR
jgi:hydroxymethylpyrimidine pyrophosphatase-like HAD family hydrolase